MQTAKLGFGARLVMALILPWQVLFNGALAERVRRAIAGEADELPPPAPTPAVADDNDEVTPIPAPVEVVEAAVVEDEAAGPDLTAALQLLALLQREGRFVDFLQENVAEFTDADIGAAARVVHEGCKRGLAEYVRFERIRTEAEGDAVTLPAGFDPARHRLTGNVVGEPPFRGILAHAGWRVAAIALPTLAEGHDASIVAPAEVEL